MTELLDKNEIDYYIPKRDSLIQQIVGDCKACVKVNAGGQASPRGLGERTPTQNSLGNRFHRNQARHV